jgi:hypothetical protein
VITRRTGYLTLSRRDAPAASAALEAQGYVVLPGVFTVDEIEALAADVDRVFDEFAPDERVPGKPDGHWAPFRYEMLNRSALVQDAIGRRAVLDVIEPLLGEDCHVIANTAWRQPPEENTHGGRFWHIDSGPHVPRPPDVAWDDRIPYPIFAVATHILLMDSPLEAGPTGVLPRSHRSGQPPPFDRMSDDTLEYDGQRAVPLVAQAGDVLAFVSDVWHRRLPSGPGDPGRYFIQCHYGRRDLAPRLRPTSASNQLSAEAISRADAADDRAKTLVGLHPPFFYDG